MKVQKSSCACRQCDGASNISDLESSSRASESAPPQLLTFTIQVTTKAYASLFLKSSRILCLLSVFAVTALFGFLQSLFAEISNAILHSRHWKGSFLNRISFSTPVLNNPSPSTGFSIELQPHNPTYHSLLLIFLQTTSSFLYLMRFLTICLKKKTHWLLILFKSFPAFMYFTIFFFDFQVLWFHFHLLSFLIQVLSLIHFKLWYSFTSVVLLDFHAHIILTTFCWSSSTLNSFSFNSVLFWICLWFRTGFIVETFEKICQRVD